MQSRSAWKSFLVKNIRILLIISLLSLSIWQSALAFHPSMDVLFTGEDGCWYTKANMPSARRALSAVELGGMIYVIGGRDGDQYDVMERYNPATNSWQTLAPMPTARAWLVSAAVNDKIYAIGGNDGGVKLNTVEEYNPATNTWATKAPMPTARDDAAVGVAQGKIYVMGGWSTGALTVVEAYDPAANTWQARSPLPSPVAMTTGAVVNEKIYVIGGRDNTSDISHNYMYDPLLNSWQVLTSLPDARSRLASGVSNGKIIVIGGYNLGQGWLSKVESYDPLLNTWETMNSMPTPRGDIAAATVSDDIFVFGGRSGFDSQVLSTNEVVDFSCTDDPPNEPANPSPGWGWTNRRLDVDLSWTGSDPNPEDSLTYDVFFGEGLTPQLVSSDQTLTTYDLPKFLEPGMDYSWRVAARDNHGVVTSSPRWTFQTSGILNMLANWSYEVDLNNWVLGVNPLAQASASYDPSTSTKGSASARVDVVDSENRLRRVQFVQNDLEFIQDKSYSLTFWAKSSIARPIAVVFRESVPPFTNFNTTTLDITTQWARYAVNLVSPDNYAPATMEFSLGGHVSSVWIDGVRLIETSAVMNASPSPSSIPSPGGAVTFNVDVENISLEQAMITALEDLDIGDITNPSNPAIITTNCNDGIVVNPSSHYTCQYQTMVSGTPGVLPRMLSASIEAGGTNVKIFDDANLTIGVTNSAPIAQNQSVSTNEDVAKAITLVATDVDGNTLTYTVVTGPTHGALSGTAPDLTYTPVSNYYGPDSFTFKANDGTVDSNTATVTIAVNSVNDAPGTLNQAVSTDEDMAKAITLVATDVDGDTLTYTVVTGPTHGDLSGTAPNLTYTPDANYYGPDSFTFKANDGTVDSNTATVTITVDPVNDDPVAVNDAFTTAEDRILNIAAPGVLGNDTDIDSATLTAVLVTEPAHGALTLNANGSFTYTPNAGYYGSDSFTYKANDGALESDVATVTILTNTVIYLPIVLNNVQSSEVFFKDGFERGNLSAWASSVTDGGDLSVSASEALVGDNGLRAMIDAIETAENFRGVIPFG